MSLAQIDSINIMLKDLREENKESHPYEMYISGNSILGSKLVMFSEHEREFVQEQCREQFYHRFDTDGVFRTSIQKLIKTYKKYNVLILCFRSESEYCQVKVIADYLRDHITQEQELIHIDHLIQNFDEY